MKYWWSADYHFGHANIIKYCMRTEFMNKEEKQIMLHGTEEQKKKLRISDESVQRMNDEIIRRHNERVEPDDYIYFVGDFCFKNTLGGKGGEGLFVKPVEYIRRMNGHFIFIRGNHDKNNSLKAQIERLVIYNKNLKNYVHMVHNPLNARDKYPLNLVGHIHDAWKVKRLNEKSIMINVGVDVWDFRPIDINEIMKEYYKFIKEIK